MKHTRLRLLSLLMMLGTLLAPSLVLAVPLLFAQAECVHTYREPGCEGGSECVRREVIPCEDSDSRPEDRLKDTLQGAEEAPDEEEPERRKGTAFGVRG